MDWSKKIGLSILIVLFLASCSNRRNYGSVYFSGGDAMNNASLKKELSIDEYMSLSDSTSDFIESVDRYADEDADSLLNLAVSAMDTMQPVKKVALKTPSQTLVKTKDHISDSLGNNTLNPIVALAEYSSDTLESSGALKNRTIDTTEILSQEEQISQLKARNDSLSIAKIEKLDTVKAERVVPISTNDTLVDTTVMKSKMADTTKILSQEEQINQLKAQNDSLNYEKIEIVDSEVTDETMVAIPVIIEEEQRIDTARTIIKEEIEKGVLLSDSLVEIENDTQPDTLDEVKETTNANINESDTLFYSVSFDSTNVVLNNSNKETLDALVKEASESNFVLQLSAKVDKSDTLETQLTDIRLDAVKNYVTSKGLSNDKISILSINQNSAKNGTNFNDGTIYCKLIIRD